MYQNEIVKIIQYLTLFELDVNTPISEEIINREFKRLAKIYHPDVANARYKDGKKFIELKEAKDYLLSNIDMVNRLIIKGFGGSSYSYEEERRYREEAARRAAEEERRRREEAARRAAEEERKRREEAARRAAEEERRKREEAARKAAAERAKIEREKKKIESDLKLLVDTIDKEAYFESDYKEIINLISSFINRLPTISNYNHEYLELLKRIKSTKTIKEIKKIKLIKKCGLIGSCCIFFVIICILLITNLIVPSIRYNNAIECIYNQEYNKAETIFKDLDGFKDSNLQLELMDVYKLLNNNQYVEAIELFEKKSGNVNIDYNPNGGEVQEKLRTSTNSRFKICYKKGYNFIKYDVENYEIRTKKELVLDIKLKAIYEIIQYNISYDLNGGVLESSNPDTYNVLSNDFNFTSPVKDGYNFMGWFNNEKEVISIKKGTVGNLLLTAKYEPISYNIIYNLNGGVNNKNNLLEYNIESSNVIINSPQKPGYSFIGWNIKGDGKIYAEFQIDTGTIGDIELTANWKANDYKITYELNGGFNNSTNPDGYVMNNGEIIIKDATKEGYSFVGWISDENSNPIKNYVINDGEYGNIKLTAIFTPNKYKILFDLNGSDNSFTDSLSVTFDSEYKLTKPTRTAYEFVAWEYNNSNFDLNGIYEISDDITLIAKWKPINYKITYNLNSGENAANNPESYNTEESIKLLSPSRVGYNFIGWSTEENQVPNLNYTIPLNSYGDLTITANFEPQKFKITYNVNNGNQLLNNEQIVEYDSLFDTVVPTRVGYTFDCWNLKDNKFEISKWNLLEDIELIASWKANEYEIEIVDEVSNKYKVTYDSNFKIENQLKDNYIFKGYYTKPYGKGIQYTDDKGNSLNIYKNANNLKLFPYYQYKVEFVSNGGSYVDSIILDENQLISKEIISEKKSRTFDGWYTDIYLINNFKEVTGNVILYAKWKEESLIDKFVFINSNNNIYITGLNVIEKEIIFPTHIGGCLVVDISSSIFYNNYIIEKIEFPNSINQINRMPSCSVKEIIIPESVKKISDYNFNGLWSLTKVYISENSCMTSIGNYAFYNSGLKQINLPHSLQVIGDRAFQTTALEAIVIPEGVKSIGQNAFAGTKIEHIIIPDSVEDIGYGALSSCNNLISIQIPFLGSNLSDNENKKIGFIFGTTNEQKHSSYVPSSLKNVTFTLEFIIGNSAFFDCKNIEKINLGQNVTNIKGCAFEYCTSLKEIVVPNSCEKIESGAFYGCTSLEKMKLPFIGESRTSKTFLSFIFGASYATNASDYIIDSLNEVIITDIVTIGDYAFYGFSSIRRIVLPESVTEIGNYAFTSCHGLSEINIPSTCSVIGEDAFYGCINLKEINLPEQMNEIKSYAFVDCWSLENINIPYGLKEISHCMFSSCYNLKTIKIPSSVISIDSSAFYSCSNLVSVEVPDSVTYIGAYAFARCSNLKFLDLPLNLITIEQCSFEDCIGLSEILIPNSVQNIGFGAFSGCSSINKISIPFVGETMDGKSNSNFGYIFGSTSSYNNIDVIPENLEVTVQGGTYLGENSFCECNNIRKIVLPDTLIRINDYAFFNCFNLEDINIPSNVVYIGELAFKGCNSLVNVTVSNDNSYFKNVDGNILTIDEKVFVLYTRGKKNNRFEIPMGVETIYGGAFSDSINLQTILIPEGVVSIGRQSFSGCTNLVEVLLPDSLNTIGIECFVECDSLVKIVLPEKLKNINAGAFAHCYKLVEINLTNKIEVIEANIFFGCSSLETIIIPCNVSAIGFQAFYGCTSLKIVYNLSSLQLITGSDENGYVAYYAEKIYTTLE